MKITLSSSSSFFLVFLGILLINVYAEDPKISTHKVDDSIYFTNHWALEISDASKAEYLAEKHGHDIVSRLEALPGVYLFRQRFDTIHGVTHPHHNESEEITWAEKQVVRELSKRDFSDPQYSAQWHLHSTSSTPNININVTGAWNLGFHGEGVRIAVVDDGLEYTHPDIADNYAADSSYDFNYNDASPFPDSGGDDHGTSAAGAAAARDNSACGVGSAYRAQLAGIRILAAGTTDYQEASAVTYEWNKNDIYSNSWGPIDDGRRLEGPGRLATAGLEQGSLLGRNGKGSLYVWAAGNGRQSGDNCNYDGWANSRFTISIGAIDSYGNQAYYSEGCSMLIASAPSSGGAYGITSSDLMGGRGKTGTDCRNNFGGTSAAAPIAAGVVALIIQSNPELGWRDVQGVIINSSVKHSPNDDGWKTNGAGYRVSHKFGFGLIDASRAVEVAKSWVNLGTQVSTTIQSTDARAIPDGSGMYESTVTITDAFTIEHTTLTLVALHSRRGDVSIKLISPSGTVSQLAEPHNDGSANFDWTFGSIFNWGETTAGVWKLQISDTRSGNSGSVQSWTLTHYGH